MKKMNVFIVLMMSILFIFVIGCSKEFVCADGTVVGDKSECTIYVDDTILDETKEKQGETSTSLDEPDEIKEDQDSSELKEVIPILELTQVQKDKLKEILVNKKSMVLPKTLAFDEYVGLGETYTYAFAIKNTNVKPATFKFSIELIEAKTESFSKIGADDAVVEWFLPHTNFDEQFILEKNEIAYVPLVIVVGEKMNKIGESTFEGTYNFRIITETVEGPFTRDYHHTDFTFRVKGDE